MGIIFTGGPNSVYLEESPHVDPEVFRLGVPILGICYGCQLMAHTLGGQVTAAQEDTAREYGKTVTYYDTGCKLFKGIPEQSISWMSHGDYMAKVPDGFALVAHTDACPNAAIADKSRGFYGVQFHPEVNHTQFGSQMLRNFLYEICGAKGTWTMGDFCKNTVAQLRDTIGPKGRVLLALSGGVDSSVLAALLAEAVGDRLTAVFVDHGCMRKNEGDEVEAAFAKWNIHFVRVDAEKRFLDKLKGVEDPQRKRQIIGAEFGYVFLDEAVKFGITKEDFFAQGTIYPDVIESGAGDADVMKCIRMLTFLPLEQINEMDTWADAKLNEAKEILAYELTKMVHGEEEAEKARAAAKALFVGGGDDANMPTTEISADKLVDGKIGILNLMVACGLAPSNKQARQLVEQGGVLVNDEKVPNAQFAVTEEMLKAGVKIRKGKKIFHKAVLA